MAITTVTVPAKEGTNELDLAVVLNAIPDGVVCITLAATKFPHETDLEFLRRIASRIYNNTKEMRKREFYLAKDICKAMKESQRYKDDDEILEAYGEMRQQVADGADPSEVLHEEGFEPDYVMDLL